MILKRYAIYLLPILLMLVSFQQAIAQDHARGRGGSGWGVGYGGITTGGHAPTIMYRTNRFYSYRFVSSDFDYEDDKSKKKSRNTYKYKQEFSLGSDALILNLHPFGGRFYFALGVTNFELNAALHGSATRTGVSDNEIDPDIDSDIDGKTFTVSADMGASLGFEGPSGYTGFGWGTKHPDKRGFGMRLELGLVHLPKPDASLYVENIELVDEDKSEEDVGQESFNKTKKLLEEKSKDYETQLEEDAAAIFTLFPVIEIGISYHF